MDWLGRLDVIVLAVLALYSVTTVVYVCVHLAHRYTGNRARRGASFVHLNVKVNNLKSIALIAPYFGLAGTCVGILDTFRSVEGTTRSVLLMVGTRIGVSLVPTIVAIPLAVFATCSYNYLRTRLNSLEHEILDDEAQRGRDFRIAGKFPLRARFSKPPAFGLIAAWLLAILFRIYVLPFTPYPTYKGFDVELASTSCADEGDDRLIVLRITGVGKLFINQEQESWNTLPDRLSDIYSMRMHKTLYLLADPSVPYQKVADAIDIANAYGITVRLVTPAALNAKCVEPVAAKRVSR